MVNFPTHLTTGDKVALIAPASSTFRPESIDTVCDLFKAKGFKLQEGKNLRKRNGFLAGTDKERLSDLMQAFSDKKVRAIFSLRGGQGSSRLLPLIDYDLIRRNPKPFIGFSDITFFAAAFLRKSNLSVFHGPSSFSLVQDDPYQFSWNKLWQALSTNSEISLIDQYPEQSTVEMIRKGTATAEIVGGNLTILQSMIGTEFNYRYNNKIVFFEDISEPPYKIDRALTQLITTGAFSGVKGFAIGLCKDCLDPVAASTDEYRQTVLDVIKDRLLKFKVPIIVGLPFGHVSCNATIPVGAKATLDGKTGDLIIHQRRQKPS